MYIYIFIFTFSSDSIIVSTGSFRLVKVESNELNVSPFDIRTFISLK